MSGRKKDDRLRPVPQEEEEKPEVYAVLKEKEGVTLSRRAFLGSMGIGALAAASGCGTGKTALGKSEVSKKPTPTVRPTPQVKPEVIENVQSAAREIKAQLCGNLRPHKSLVESVCVSPDGKLLASGSESGTIKLWSLPEGKHLKTFKGHTKVVLSVCISSDGKLLASAGRNGTIKLWSLPEGKLVKTLKGRSQGVCISPDGKLLASTSRDGIKLWSLPEGRLVKTLKGSYCGGVCVSPDGKLLASGSESGTIKLWSLPEGKHLKTLKGHKATASVRNVSISPDGKFLASTSWDIIKLWSLPEGKLVKTFKGHRIGAHFGAASVFFSPDGKLLVSQAYVAIKLWSLPEGTPNWCLFDPSIIEKRTNVKTCRQMGPKTYTLPCGAPIPAGAVCTCNCIGGSIQYPGPQTVCVCDTISVPVGSSTPSGAVCTCNTIAVGSYVPPVPKGHKRKMSGGVCTCDTICTCNTISTPGSHYWHPN